MKIRDKLGVSVTGLSLIIVFMFVATWWSTNQQKDDGLVINLAGRQRMLSQKMTKEFLLNEIEKQKKGTHDPKLVKSVKTTIDIFDKTLSALKDSGHAPLSLDPDHTTFREVPKAQEPAYTQLEKVATIWSDYKGYLEKVLALNESPAENLAFAASINVKLLAEMNNAVGMMQKQSEGRVKHLLVIQAVCVVVGVAVMIFAFYTVLKILARLNRVKSFAAHLGRGDLRVQSGYKTRDEIGLIGVSLDEMVDNLKEMIGVVDSIATNMNSSSSDLFKISSTVSDNTVNVSSRSDTVAGTARQMSDSMNSVAAAVEEASTNVSLMATAAEEIKSTITGIVGSTEKASTVTEKAVIQAKEASKRVNSLGTAAKEIGKVTETITEISEQTNLLALNATIEAARAGEAGKGFAVVANEIKDLAGQTAAATLDIKTKISGVQSSTSETVMEIGEISKIVDQVNEIVSQITGAVDEQSTTTSEIADNVTQASIGIQEVAQNVAQNSTAAEDVANDIAEVNSSSSEIALGSSKVQENADNYLKLSQRLSEVVNRFKM